MIKHSPGCLCCCDIFRFSTSTPEEIAKFANGVTLDDQGVGREFDGTLQPGESLEVKTLVGSDEICRIWLDLVAPQFVRRPFTNANPVNGSAVSLTVDVAGVDPNSQDYIVRADIEYAPGVDQTTGWLTPPGGTRTLIWQPGDLPSDDTYTFEQQYNDPALTPNGQWLLEVNAPSALWLYLFRVTILEPGNVASDEPFEFEVEARNADPGDGWTYRETSYPKGDRVCLDDTPINSAGDDYHRYYTTYGEMWLDYDKSQGYAERNMWAYGYDEASNYSRLWVDDIYYFNETDGSGPYIWQPPAMVPPDIQTGGATIYSFEEEVGSIDTVVVSDYEPGDQTIPIMFPWTLDLGDLIVKLKNTGTRTFEMRNFVAERVVGLEPADSWNCEPGGEQPTGSPVNSKCYEAVAVCPQLDDFRLLLTDLTNPSSVIPPLPNSEGGSKVACAGASGSFCTPNVPIEQRLLVRSKDLVGPIDWDVIAFSGPWVYDPIGEANRQNRGWDVTTIYPPDDWQEYARGYISQGFHWRFDYTITRIAGTNTGELSAVMRIFYVPFATYPAYITEVQEGDWFVTPLVSMDWVTGPPSNQPPFLNRQPFFEGEIYVRFDNFEEHLLFWNPVTIDLCDWVPGYKYTFPAPDSGAETPLSVLGGWRGEWRYTGSGAAPITLRNEYQHAVFDSGAPDVYSQITATDSGAQSQIVYEEGQMDFSGLTIEVELFDPVARGL